MKQRLFEMKTNSKILIIILLIAVIGNNSAFSQRWKRVRWDCMAGIGTTSFTGDLGGGSKDAAHFLGVRDLDISTTRPLFHFGLRYKLLEPLSLKVGFSYGLLKADDKNSGSAGRKSRNLNFKSPIAELAFQMEYAFIKERIGSRYAIARGGFRNLINAYAFVGLGFIYFNPKGEYDGKWYELQPLGTQGQGMIVLDGAGKKVVMPAKYSKMALSFPLGLGVKYMLTKDLSLGVEVGMRYTSTDFIDDCSLPYFNYGELDTPDPETGQKALLTSYNKDVLMFDDKHIISNDKETGAPIVPTRMVKKEEWNNKYDTGTPYRGSSNYNDAYTFMIISIVYKLKTGRTGLPKF